MNWVAPSLFEFGVQFQQTLLLPSSMKLRTFISHSAKDDGAKEVQQALVSALEDSDLFGVLLDQITLEVGDAWRARINLWVGGCDAAVVLLSEEALKSPYVAYEVSILGYRRAMNPSFLLIPIFLGNVDEARIQSSYLFPSQLTELQAVRGATTREIVDQVVERLGEAKRCNDLTPVERRARWLADELIGIEDSYLLEAADEIRLDLGPWAPSENLRLRLAIQLLSVGMKAALPAILMLREHLPKSERERGIDRIIDLVATSWVDPRSIARLPEIVRGTRDTRVVGVNGSKTLTARMYFLSASRESKVGWHLATCDGVFGEDVLETLKQKLRRTLMAELKVKSEAELQEDLEALDDSPQQPVLIAFPYPGITGSILKELRKEFPSVTFFLLMGEMDEGAPLSNSTVELLLPQLGKGDETAFHAQYDRFERKVRLRC